MSSYSTSGLAGFAFSLTVPKYCWKPPFASTDWAYLQTKNPHFCQGGGQLKLTVNLLKWGMLAQCEELDLTVYRQEDVKGFGVNFGRICTESEGGWQSPWMTCMMANRGLLCPLISCSLVHANHEWWIRLDKTKPKIMSNDCNPLGIKLCTVMSYYVHLGK